MAALEQDLDLEFLGQINRKLHLVKRGVFEPNIAGQPFPISWDTYTKSSLSEEELRKVLNIVEKNRRDFFISPMNTAFGFSVGFYVGKISVPAVGLEPEIEMVLAFKESQLPKGYDFQKLSAHFMNPENLARAEFARVEKIVNNRTHYDY